MGFKENMLQKIEIDRLAQTVVASIGTPESGRKVDKPAMQKLLDIGAYAHLRRRQMDLYLKKPDQQRGAILVLDNDLTLYDTTVDDAVMRKNPLFKEMLSLGNIRKILNDKDVVISRKDESVRRIQQECIAALDLSYSDSDIALLAREGQGSLDGNDPEGVLESLAVFSEILDLKPAPQAYRFSHHEIVGELIRKDTDAFEYGPVVIYSRVDNTIKLMEQPLDISVESAIDSFKQVVNGRRNADRQGHAVFQYLKDWVGRKT